DAISSAVGSWRRHPDARWTITVPDIPKLAARQLHSLALASEAVRPGGLLIYTVPTVTRSETVAVVQAFLGAHPQFQLDPFPHPLEEGTTGGMLQIWPQAHDGEARFIARLLRRANEQETTSAKKAKQTSSAQRLAPVDATNESIKSSRT